MSDLAAGQEATGVFLVRTKDVRQKRSGEPYLSLMLADRTGELDAKMWDNAASVADTFDKDDFVRVKGQVQLFQNRRQLTIQRLQFVAPQEIDMADFLPASKRPIDEMVAELRAVVGAMETPHLRGLMAAFFADEELVRAYRTAPAAKSVHHAYVGGLLEHVLSMVAIAKMLAAHYEGIDRDLLISGVLLHDIGKTRELTYDRTFGYSTEGQLIGHIQIAMQMLSEKIRAVPGFPAKTRMLLEHMILSHHGELAYGSPKVPLFAEAMLLHQIDLLDSKMNQVLTRTADDPLVEGEWTSYVPTLERSLLKKDRFLGSSTAAPAPPETAAKVVPGNAVPEAVAPAVERSTAEIPTSASSLADKLSGAWKRN